MKIQDVPFCAVDWSAVEPTIHTGVTGRHAGAPSKWATSGLVDDSPGYLADHWCDRGHALLVLEDELVTELSNGRKITLTPGTSYQVAEDANPHQSHTEKGARLFVVD